MWYFAWMLGVGFAVLLAILNAMWGENEEARKAAQHTGKDEGHQLNLVHLQTDSGHAPRILACAAPPNKRKNVPWK